MSEFKVDLTQTYEGTRFYKIPVLPNASDLLYIENLLPNQHYVLTINDLNMSFFSNGEGIIYWNESKDALPLGLAYDDAWGLEPPFTQKTNTLVPRAVFKPSNMIWTKDNNRPFRLSVDLSYYEYNTQTIKRVKRFIQFKNNSAVLLRPDVKQVENFISNFSGIGVL
jgi:hypothetical protein